MSVVGFYKEEYSIKFKYLNYLGESVTIGTADKGDELGEYRLTWENVPKGDSKNMGRSNRSSRKLKG